jgi:hypothetical protein
MRKLFIHSFLPLFLGSFIYLCFRKKSILLFKWLDNYSVDYYALSVRSFFNPNDIAYSNIFVSNIPNGLWVYSFTSILLIVWKGKFSGKNLIYIITPVMLAFISEMGQFFGLITGTFDVLDLFLYIFGFIISFKFCYVKK